ncbi:MAG: hypothetical protein ACC682_05980 [Gemmatimonadota bacterium]
MNEFWEWLRDRSLWQVLGVYLAGSWVGFEITATITEALQLPVWLPRGALILIAAGLPIVVAAVLLRRREGVFTLRGAVIMGAGAFAALFAAAGLSSVFVSQSESTSTDPAAGSEAAGGIVYTELADDPRPAIAVLPFLDLSPEGDQEYFSDGISDEILTVLSRIRGLRVASRASAFTYKGTDLDMQRVGAELHVPHLLAGTVRKDGNQLRITVELVNVSDGTRLWSTSYDRLLEGVFAIQSEIAEAVAEALRVPLGLAPEDLVAGTFDTEAHDLYLSGRAALRRRGPGVGEAVALFEAALARDSMWAPAWAGLAVAHVTHPFYTGLGGESTDSVFWAQSMAAGEAAARRALALDPRNSSARVALGDIHRDRWEWAEAERELLRALADDPDDAEAHLQYSELLWGVGRLDEALRESGRALALDRSPLTLDVHGFVLYMNGRNEEAEAVLEEGLAIDTAGDMHYLRTVLATLMLFDGRYREALDRFSDYLPDADDFRMMGEALAAGDPSLLPEHAARGFAQTLARLGRTEEALDALERLVFALPYRVQYDIWDPNLIPLQQTARFQDVILPRVRLEGVKPTYAGPAPSGDQGR